jgi:sugar lactone lactonase YvrE
VANYGGNQILVYNPSYVQESSISEGVSNPVGVAFDSLSNLYVSNRTAGTVTVYDSTLTQNTSATISGLSLPSSLAVDGLDDVWVVDGYGDSTVYMYSPAGTLLGTSTPGVGITSLAIKGRWYVLGSAPNFTQYPAGEVLTNTGIAGSYSYPSPGDLSVDAMAFDATGNYYVFNQDAGGTLIYVNPYTHSTALVQSGFALTITGIAVDSTRGRIYLSDYGKNVIYVYSTKGKLLKTIK